MAALAGAGASVDAAVAIEEPCRATVGWGDSGGRAPSQEEFLERASAAWDGDTAAAKRRRRRRGVAMRTVPWGG